MESEDLEKREMIVSYNPATGKELGRAKKFSHVDVQKALKNARDSFALWKTSSFSERAQIIMRARKIINRDIDAISLLISDEMGKPIAEALSTEIVPVLDLMQYFAKNAEKMLRSENRDIGMLRYFGRYSQIHHRPLGVIGIISPWNFPLSIPLGETVMAIMAGNVVILKPSELTPLVGEKIAEIFVEARLPTDVLQVVSGDGGTGAALVDIGVDKIMFTGSVATGKQIAKAAANTLTPVVLELGGKDPMIVLRDADLDKASSAAVWGAFTNSGQACSSVERLYVDQTVAEEFKELVVKKTGALHQGLGCEPNSDVATLSSVRQREIVERHVEQFRDSGAEILTGGTPLTNLGEAFYPPTVISNVNNEMEPMQVETFGPTLPIAIFETEDEAVRLANDSEFGLTASIWTKDISRGKMLANKIVAGTVMINEVVYTHGIAQTPWGGFKNSGYGRTHGKEGLMELVSPQHIHVNRFTYFPDMWWFSYSNEAIRTFKKMAKTFASGSMARTIGFLPQMWKRIYELKK